jgi:hypothetical protein
MTVAALIVADTKEIIKIFNVDNPIRIDLPGVGQVSPAEIGWEGDGFAIIEVQKAEIPEGKVSDGAVTYEVVGDVVVGSVPVKDAPPPPPAPRDVLGELDALSSRVAKLEGK